MSDNLTVDLYNKLGITLNSDGTIIRAAKITCAPAMSDPDPTQPAPVLTKDLPLNQSKGTSIRIFLPHEALDSSSTPTNLPLLVYFHGGGFIVGSATMPLFHDFCSIIAVEIPAVIVSVGYRLAPEHRLPAAYDDSVEALHYIKTNNDEWLTKFADFSKTYLMGSSAGGNIAYHVGFRVAAEDLGPLKIQGLILHQPFFGGTKRTESETRLTNDLILPLYVNDLMWELGLPVGVDRDHEYSNPTAVDVSWPFDEIVRRGWKVLVSGCDGDPLMDRQMEFVKMLEEKGVKVTSEFGEGGCHGAEFFDHSKLKTFALFIKHFILF